MKVEKMYVNDKKTGKAVKGDVITIKVPEKVRDKDKLYVVIERKHWQGNN